MSEKEISEVEKLRAENLALKKQLKQLAIRDPLTSLYSEEGFYDVLGKFALQLNPNGELNPGGEEKREQQGIRSITVAHFDGDKFKVVNDRFSHRAGDQAIIEVGLALKRWFRAGDVIARLHGDEFVVGLINGTPQAVFRKLGWRNGELAATPPPIKFIYRETEDGTSHGITITVSGGFAIYELLEAKPGETHEACALRSLKEAVHRADLAMYRAKGFRDLQIAEGRNPGGMFMSYDHGRS